MGSQAVFSARRRRGILRPGTKLLKLRLAQQEQDAATVTAWTSAMVDAGCLWWFLWMQFVAAFFYGLPLFGNLFDATFAIRYYLPPEGWGVTVPELFLAASIGLAVLAVGRCQVMSRRGERTPSNDVSGTAVRLDFRRFRLECVALAEPPPREFGKLPGTAA